MEHEQLSLVDPEGADLDWHDTGVDRTGCDGDPPEPKAGDLIDRHGLNRGKVGNRPNSMKFDARSAVPAQWARRGVTPWPFREDGSEDRGVLVAIEHAFGSVPELGDVDRTVGALIGASFSRTDQELSQLWTHEAGVQHEVLDRAEFARAVFGSGFGENAVASLFPTGRQPLRGYLPHLGLDGPGRYRCEPDVVWMADDRSRVYIGEVKVAARHLDRTFSHRQVYLPWLVARQLWPDTEVVPVFVWVNRPGEVLVSEVEYPGGDIVGARLVRTPRASGRLSSLAGGRLRPVFIPR